MESTNLCGFPARSLPPDSLQKNIQTPAIQRIPALSGSVLVPEAAFKDGFLFQIQLRRNIDLIRNVFSVFLALAHTLGEQILNLSVH